MNWFVGWLVGWSVGRPVVPSWRLEGWLVFVVDCYLVGRLAGSYHRLVVWLVISRVCFSSEGFISETEILFIFQKN